MCAHIIFVVTFQSWWHTFQILACTPKADVGTTIVFGSSGLFDTLLSWRQAFWVSGLWTQSSCWHHISLWTRWYFSVVIFQSWCQTFEILACRPKAQVCGQIGLVFSPIPGDFTYWEIQLGCDDDSYGSSSLSEQI
jgi:hypothetical protein